MTKAQSKRVVALGPGVYRYKGLSVYRLRPSCWRIFLYKDQQSYYELSFSSLDEAVDYITKYARA